MSRKKRSRNRTKRESVSPPADARPPATYLRSWYWLVAGVLAVAFTGFGVWWAQRPIESPRIMQLVEDKVVLTAPTYVGRAACVECHAEQDRLWRGSHHDLAMQEANKNAVLGNFDNVTFRYAGVTSTFFKRDDKFFVRTDGPDGKLADFEIKYTFGVTPLQQYLVEFPRGRLQALSIAWDARSKEQGGQRWFHLYPGERITHTDELHWTGPRQNWNFMCADCHSTNLRKDYDPTHREYHTTWSEINVSCEACHGPGSRHVTWARREEGWNKINARSKGLIVALDERKDVRWVHDPQSDTPKRSPPRHTETEIQVCAPCHSRRAQLFDDDRPGQALMESYLPSLLVEGLYRADGQIDGEVYVYGSFLQSKMYKAGVTCSDCHDPHSLALKEGKNTRQRNTTFTAPNQRGRTVLIAICRRRPTWSSIRDVITAFASRGPTSRLSSVPRTPAAVATMTDRRHGQRRRCENGTVTRRSAINNTPKRCTRRARVRRTPRVVC